jgi:hypothetical protein
VASGPHRRPLPSGRSARRRGFALVLPAAALLLAAPAHACHRFSVWKYPYPQRCAVAQVQVDRSWFVEITDVPLGVRTSEQEADAREHDEAVRQHKGEINDLMQVLKLNEREAGYQGVEDK